MERVPAVSWVMVGFFPALILGVFIYVWRHPQYRPSSDLRRADDEPALDPADKADLWVWRGGRGG